MLVVICLAFHQNLRLFLHDWIFLVKLSITQWLFNFRLNVFFNCRGVAILLDGLSPRLLCTLMMKTAVNKRMLFSQGGGLILNSLYFSYRQLLLLNRRFNWDDLFVWVILLMKGFLLDGYVFYFNMADFYEPFHDLLLLAFCLGTSYTPLVLI